MRTVLKVNWSAVKVGKVQMPPLKLPEPIKLITCKQYHIPGGHKEIRATIQEYIQAGVMVSITTEWNNPIWPVRKSNGT